MESDNIHTDKKTMTVNRLHWILGAAIRDGLGDFPLVFMATKKPKGSGDIVTNQYNISDWKLISSGQELALYLITEV